MGSSLSTSASSFGRRDADSVRAARAADAELHGGVEGEGRHRHRLDPPHRACSSNQRRSREASRRPRHDAHHSRKPPAEQRNAAMRSTSLPREARAASPRSRGAPSPPLAPPHATRGRDSRRKRAAGCRTTTGIVCAGSERNVKSGSRFTMNTAVVDYRHARIGETRRGRSGVLERLVRELVSSRSLVRARLPPGSRRGGGRHRECARPSAASTRRDPDVGGGALRLLHRRRVDGDASQLQQTGRDESEHGEVRHGLRARSSPPRAPSREARWSPRDRRAVEPLHGVALESSDVGRGFPGERRHGPRHVRDVRNILGKGRAEIHEVLLHGSVLGDVVPRREEHLRSRTRRRTPRDLEGKPSTGRTSTRRRPR